MDGCDFLCIPGTGVQLNGEIMNFGGDRGLIHSDSINEINTRYLLRNDDGWFISIRCREKLIMNMTDMEEVCEDEAAPPSDLYC